MKTHEQTAAMLAAVCLAISLAGCGSSAAVPAGYTPYNAKDGSFKIDRPAEWESAGGGKGGYAWAKFTSGSAEIKVETGVTGSLIGDIAQSQNQGLEPGGVPDELAPVAKVHEFEKDQFLTDTGFQESDPVTVKTGLGDARKSELTGSGSFGGSVRGYRATALGHDKRVRVVCQCPESEWEALKPAFDKVIESLSPGTPER